MQIFQNDYSSDKYKFNTVHMFSYERKIIENEPILQISLIKSFKLRPKSKIYRTQKLSFSRRER